MPDRSTPSRPGFTLVELLIVLVIITILTAIAIPNLAEAREEGYIATMRSDLRTLSAAIVEYRAANGSLPDGGALGTAIGATGLVSDGIQVLAVVTSPAGMFPGQEYAVLLGHEDSTVRCILYSVDFGVDEANIPRCFES